MSENTSADDRFARRAELAKRHAVVPVAFSTDGREVGFVGPLDLGVSIGGFAVVEAGEELVVIHVHDVHLATREGSIGGDGDDVSIAFALRHVRGTGVVLGVLAGGAFRGADRLGPFGERRVRAVMPEELEQVLSALDGDAATISIGALRDSPGLPARLRSKGFSGTRSCVASPGPARRTRQASSSSACSPTARSR